MVGPFGLVWFVVASAYTRCCHSVNWKLRDVCHIVSRAGIEPAFTRHVVVNDVGAALKYAARWAATLCASIWPVEAFDRGANPVATVQAVAFHVI